MKEEIIIDTTWREVPEIYLLPGQKHRSFFEIEPQVYLGGDDRKHERRMEMYRQREAEREQRESRSINRCLAAITAIASSGVGLCLGCSIIGAVTPPIGAAGVAGLIWCTLFAAANAGR